MVRVTIDGTTLEVPAGTTILQAADRAGIEIPRLCDHPAIKPYGACRLCLVEVEGARTLQPSCTLPVSEGMVAYTNTPKVREARKFVLTLIFSERNHFCMYCPVSGGDCELQNAAYAEEMTHWPLQPNWEPYPVDASHPYFILDHNRCILCRRCVRACAELVGNFTLGVAERGARSRLVADADVPIKESSCVGCGTCIQVCPTGALIDRWSAYRGREKDTERIRSTCIGCSVGCGLELIVRDNHLLRVEGDWEAPVNQGLLCEVGRFRWLNDTRERIVTPLVRKNGVLKAATWDEALETVAARLKPLAGRDGDGIAALASTRLPLEALALFKQLFGGQLGASMVTGIEEHTTAAVPVALAQELGQPFEGQLEALKSADCVVAAGVNLLESHQVAGFFIKRALPNGTKLVVIDPGDSEMHTLADYSLKLQKGTDYHLLMGIMAGIAKLGLVKGATPALPDPGRYSPELVGQATGIPAETILEVARLLGTAKRPAFVYGKGLTNASSRRALKALVELARLVGALDETHSALIGVKGQANSLAAALYGLDTTFQVNGHQAVYLALGDDTASQRLIQRLEPAPFLAVQASYVSPVTARADVVLPVEIWAEQEGHYLNLEGRLQATHRALTPPEDVRANADVLLALAERVGGTIDVDWKTELQRPVAPAAILA